MSDSPFAFSSLVPGMELPSLEFEATRETLVRYAGASDDYVYLHWDQERVKSEGFPDVVVHGWLTAAWIARAAQSVFPPDQADIRDFAIRYRRTSHPGKVTCGGTIVACRQDAGERHIDLDLWAKDESGTVTTTAAMTLALT